MAVSGMGQVLVSVHTKLSDSKSEGRRMFVRSLTKHLNHIQEERS